MNKQYLLLLLSSIALSAVDFDQSMKRDSFPIVLEKANERKRFAFFKALYTKHNPEIYQNTDIIKIPHIMHHIWLGKKLPAQFSEYRESWIRNHLDWLFVFWTDSPVNFDQGLHVVNSFQEFEQWLNDQDKREQFCVVDVRNLSFDNRSFYDQAKNYGEKSDILKWEIVYRFGGVYVDTDFECLQPIDFFHSVYDFYTGIQPLDTNHVQLGAALFGATPGHPILKQCVQGIKNNQHIAQIVAKTGPLHFTYCFVLEAGKEGRRDIALPASYLYPCGYEQRGMSSDCWQMPESYAVHHWAGSWLKPEGFER